MSTLTRDEAEKILIHIQNWIINDDNNPINDLEYDNRVSMDEVGQAYDDALDQVLSYTCRRKYPEDTVVNNVFCTARRYWAAGLLFKKYDTRPNDQTDETVTVGYGDSLIIQAKVMLKPYRYYRVNIF